MKNLVKFFRIAMSEPEVQLSGGSQRQNLETLNSLAHHIRYLLDVQSRFAKIRREFYTKLGFVFEENPFNVVLTSYWCKATREKIQDKSKKFEAERNAYLQGAQAVLQELITFFLNQMSILQDTETRKTLVDFMIRLNTAIPTTEITQPLKASIQEAIARATSPQSR